MADQLVGGTYPWLSPDAQMQAAQAKLADTANNFDATDVEGALSEIVATLIANNMWTPPVVTVVPGVPRSVVATAGIAAVTLTWVAPASDGGSPVVGYDIQRSTNASTGFTTVITVNALTYTNTGLTNGTPYYFKVVAKNSVGNGSASAAVTATPSAAAAAATVTAVSSSQNPAVSGASVTITATVTSGTGPVTTGTVTFTEGATVLASGVALNSSGMATYVSTSLSVATHTITATYSGTGAFSGSTSSINQIISASAAGTAPSAPRTLVATASPVGVTLNWTIPVDGNLTGGSPQEIASYNIEQSTNPTTGFTLVATVAGASTMPKLIYPLTAGVTYHFRVRASYMVTPTAYSVPSNVANATPTAGPAVPATWAAAVATNDLTAITLWYQANTGYDSEGITFTDLWGPGQSDFVTINDTWLTANAAAGRVVNDGGGHWTVSKLHAQYILVGRDNVTLSHCLADRPFAANQGGFGAVDNTTTGTPPTPSTTYRGIIIDHCTARGNFGDGTHNAYGDGLGYYNDTNHAPDGFIARYCDIYGYRAGFLMWFGSTCQYNWVHDLYIWSDSHNTAHSIRGENCTINRCLLTDGTSSAISLYADSNPFTKFYLTENILTTWGNALQEVNFPTRGTGWSVLANGYDRQLVGNMFKDGSAGDLAYFTKVSGNKLITGRNLFMDTGEPQVAHQPSLQQFRYYDFGNPVPSMSTYEFTPTPNSTLLVLVAAQNGGHTTVPTPTVTAVGQLVAGQTFTKIAETASDVVGDTYQCKLLLYKAPVGATTSFEHINVNFTGNGSADYYATFWVFEVTLATNLVLVRYAPNIQHNPAFGGVLTTLASGTLSGAPTNGNLVMAFCAGSSLTSPNTMGNQAGWNKIGVSDITVRPGNFPGVVGAAYWRKDFTATSMSLTNLGNGISPAGLLLCEFSGA